MRYLYWPLVLLVAALLASFAVSNREAVELTIWPLPYLITAPFYLVLFVAVAASFIIGRIVGFIAASPVRRERRKLRSRVITLEAELAGLRPSISPAAAAGTTFDTGLVKKSAA